MYFISVAFFVLYGYILKTLREQMNKLNFGRPSFRYLQRFL